MLTGLIACLFFAMLLVWLVYDVLVELWLKKRYGQPTITHFVYTNSYKYPAIPALVCLIIGLLIGHFWLQF